MPRALLLTLALVTCGGAGTETDPGTTTTDPETGADASTATSGATPTSTAAPTSTGDTGDDTAADTSTGEPAIDYGADGPHPVGNTRFSLPAGDRALLVELWYPADAGAAAAAATGHPIADFVPVGPDQDTFTGLLLNLSPAGEIGTRLQTRSAFDAAPAAGGPWPLVVFSHCHNCVRFSAFTVAERLASHGFVVAAPDHAGNTLFDDLAGNGADLGEEFLVVRVGDMQAVLDAVLDPDAAAVPAPVRGLADPARVGALGHSFGAATVGRLAQVDPRVLAAMPIAAPVENPIFPNTHLADIRAPLLMVLAEEDNSILAIGNTVLVNNFKAANPPVRLVSVADAGHWNFTDICGLVDGFAAGCGDGERQTDGTPFTYLDIAVGREIAAAYSLAFFDRWLRDAPAADAFLDAATPADVVTVDARL